MMGIGTLRDLALIQLIGVIEGIFSSLFLATPILVSLVNRQDKHKEHAAAVEAFRNGDADAEGLQPEAPREEAATRKRTVVAPQPTEPHAPATSSTWRPNAR